MAKFWKITLWSHCLWLECILFWSVIDWCKGKIKNFYLHLMHLAPRENSYKLRNQSSECTLGMSSQMSYQTLYYLFIAKILQRGIVAEVFFRWAIHGALWDISFTTVSSQMCTINKCFIKSVRATVLPTMYWWKPLSLECCDWSVIDPIYRKYQLRSTHRILELRATVASFSFRFIPLRISIRTRIIKVEGKHGSILIIFKYSFPLSKRCLVISLLVY